MAELLRRRYPQRPIRASGGRLWSRQRGDCGRRRLDCTVARGTTLGLVGESRQRQVDARPLHSRPDASRWRPSVFEGDGGAGSIAARRLARLPSPRAAGVPGPIWQPRPALDGWPQRARGARLLPASATPADRQKACARPLQPASGSIRPSAARLPNAAFRAASASASAIAAALASEPELIVADEPVSGARHERAGANPEPASCDLQRDLGLASHLHYP